MATVLRLVFLTRVTLLKYRLGLQGFQLPAELIAAQAGFDRELATRLDVMADRLEGKASTTKDTLELSLARLEEASRIHASAAMHDSSGSVRAMLLLSHRIERVTASLDQEVV